MKCKFNHLSLAVCLLVALSLLHANPIKADAGQANEQQATIVPSARSRFVLPKLPNFQKFKLFYGKSYDSISENLVRMKIYLARVANSFVSSVNYKLAKRSSYLSVNPMSDWTPEERARIRVNMRQLESSSKIDRAQGIAAEREELKKVELAMEQIELPKERPELRDLANEMEFIKTLERPSMVPQSNKTRTGWLKRLVNGYLPSMGAGKPQDEPLGDKIFVDHRNSGCLAKIRAQGLCGSCYSFASIAMFEYKYCTQTGKLVEFSEQYIVDCMVKEGKLRGCEGAPIEEPVDFIHKFGLELRDNYPYKHAKRACPFGDMSVASDWGLYRPKKGAEVFRPWNRDLTKYLKDGPILHALKVADEFHDYGGGVDHNEGCRDDYNHAMLLVGHGIEDGSEYLVYRNSHSDAWGEEGYYKMHMDALDKCATYEYGIVSESKFRGDGLNKQYKGAELLTNFHRESESDIGDYWDKQQQQMQ